MSSAFSWLVDKPITGIRYVFQLFQRHMVLPLGAWFVVVAVVPLLLVLWLSHLQNESIIEAESKLQFKMELQYRMERLQQWLQVKKGAMVGHAQNPTLQTAFSDSLAIWQQTSSFQQVTAQLDLSQQKYLKFLEESGGFYDLFFISPTGRIFYTLEQEADLGEDLTQLPLRDSPLGKAWNMSRYLLDIQMSNIDYYPPSDRLGFFLVMPMIHHGRLIGYFAGQLETGDLVTIFEQKPASVVPGKFWVGAVHGRMYVDILASLEMARGRQMVALPVQSLTSQPILRAMHSESGAGKAIGIDGGDVFAAWSYLPDFGWGMVYQKPLDQVYKTLDQQNVLFVIVIVLTLIFVSILSLLFYGYLYEPIEALMTGMKRFSTYKTLKPDQLAASKRYQVAIKGNNEFAQLGRVFNDMSLQLVKTLREQAKKNALLAEQQAEIKAYSEKLAEKVAEKTQHLAATQNEMRFILHYAPMMIMNKDLHGRYTMVNRQAADLLGKSALSLEGLDDLDIFPPTTAQVIRKHDSLVLSGRDPKQFEESYYGRDFLVLRFLLESPESGIYGICSMGVDVTEQKAIEKKLQETSELRQRVAWQLQQSYDIQDQFIASLIIDESGKLAETSQAWLTLFGFDRAAVQTKPLERILQCGCADPGQCKAEEQWRQLKRVIQEVFERGETSVERVEWLDLEQHTRYFEVTVTPIWDDKNEIHQVQTFWQDRTNEEKITRLAITDALTGLYNRHQYNELSQTLLKDVAQHNNVERLGFVLLDVDFFKQYNDSCGHLAGDEALQQIGQCCLALSEQTDHPFFRLGGEEFAAFVVNTTESDLKAFAEQVRQSILALAIEHPKNAASRYLSISVGITLGKLQSLASIDLLYQQADLALYHAKESGRNQVVLFSNLSGEADVDAL
ncbi:hypothetical protein CYQ88_05630 [Hydrogenovibrio sp. SC-1]|uniref:diguanylate cyclase domain-containing protein n=1 Tax=Hydrogenovibrio sp. SC-1 TaxID=2065820 RepID=UPI000C7A5146|nr:diguanylate cyclase [Hydrogenovibrio sp. SC-1]PLA74561.1 hypothetical protein CYQ88_05630 [Hydrogenovibrio sp. SC-1]